MPNDLSASDPARRRDPDRHLEDDPAALDTFLASKRAEHDRQEADKAAWDRSAALFTSKLPTATPAIAALRAQLGTPPPSTLSREAARALATHANQTLALYGGNVRPLPKPSTPPVPTPPAPTLSSEDELSARIAAEREFQGGMRSGSLTPEQRASREAALATLQHASDEQSPDANVRKLALYRDLADLGAPQPCRATDTVKSLTAKRDALIGAASTKARDEVDHHATMGLDGKIGAPDEVALYEAEQRLETLPKTGTGVLLVGIASARGASTEELRAAGARGEMVEGLAGGAAHVFESERRTPERELDSTQRPAPGKLPHDGNSPKPQVNGHTVKNWRYAFKSFQLSPELAAKYPAGVRFKANGFPDFSPYAKATVTLQGLTGKNRADEPRALRAAGLAATPEGYMWHHVEDGETMQLVPRELHKVVTHTGGYAVIKAIARKDGEP